MRKLGYSLIAAAVVLLFMCSLLALRPLAVYGAGVGTTLYPKYSKYFVIINLDAVTTKTSKPIRCTGQSLYPDVIAEKATLTLELKTSPPAKLKCLLVKHADERVLYILNFTEVLHERTAMSKYLHYIVPNKQASKLLGTVKVDKQVVYEGKADLLSFADYALIIVEVESSAERVSIDLNYAEGLRLKLATALPRIAVVALCGIALIAVSYYREKREWQ